ncbi:MAG: glycosyltransferase family 4 protein [Acidobacteriota bacterium]
MKILFLSHGHPSLQVGGAEVYAYELFKGIRDLPGFEAVFLARSSEPGHNARGGTPFRGLDGRSDEILWQSGRFEGFYKVQPEKDVYTVHLRELLEEWRPDLVHVQHTDGIGYDILREIRRTVPAAPIVYTLHELQAICHAHGLMITWNGGQLCRESSPARCHGCFPHVAPGRFYLRERMIRSQLDLVDQFLAPSQFLLERYVEWGIPRDRIRFEEYGRMPQDTQPGEPPRGGFAFFGQVAPHKGLLVLLKAVELLRNSGFLDFHLFIHGGNLEKQPPEFRQRFDELLTKTSDQVTFLGRYRVRDLARLMREAAWVVVPSVWWENSPLVIQEAFMHGRPVICSDIGGMAEKVTDGVDGLHFRVGDAASLAATMRTAAGSPELWRRLRDGIRPVYTMAETVDFHAELYRELAARRKVA